METILIVEDDRTYARATANWLARNGMDTRYVLSADAAKEFLGSHEAALVLSDFRLGDCNGVELLEWMRAHGYRMPFLVMTGYGDISGAVEAVKKGADNYLPKPVQTEKVLGVIRGLLGRGRKRTMEQNFYICKSPPAVRLQEMVRLVAPADGLSVLIRGASGTGKERVARQIHAFSKRSAAPFVAVDCGALPRELAASELFGHKKGAFTGAVRDKAGKFELADGGTLFLDEIGELSATAQSKLLRFLEDKVIERVGDNKPIRLDVRIIAATNRDLAAMMKSGTFREDLYYRLNVFECTVPPLRERPEDIEPLAAKLLRSASAKYGTPPTLSQAARQALLRYGWPGNVRELRNVMERVALLAAGREVTLADLPPALSAGEGVRSGPDEEPHILTLRELEAEHIRRVLGLGVSMERAAELLGINTVTLWRKRKELGA